MSYSTISDIKNQIEDARLVQLTDDEGLGTINEARVARAIADADEEIDGYVGARHTVPLSPAPAILRKMSVDIAIYNLYSRRDEVPESRATRYEGAIKFLEQVALGKISLGARDPEGNPPEADAPEMSRSNPPRAFDRGSMREF
ncbi:MAG: DUF1320 domain-containing protein [Syntrophobacteraceae bacterium]